MAPRNEASRKEEKRRILCAPSELAREGHASTLLLSSDEQGTDEVKPVKSNVVEIISAWYREQHNCVRCRGKELADLLPADLAL